MSANRIAFIWGAAVAIIHVAVVAIIFSTAGKSEGSWQGFQAFFIDFPISILFLSMSDSHALPLVHATIGSIWWFALTWAVVRATLFILQRRRRHLDP